MAGCHDLACDAPAKTLLPVSPDQVGQLLFAEPLQQGAGRFALRRIHAHVERSLLLEAEAAFCQVDLIRANAQIGQHAVDLVDSLLLQHDPQLGEVGLDESNGQAGQARLGQVEHGRVLVEAEQPAQRPEPFGDQPGAFD